MSGDREIAYQLLAALLPRPREGSAAGTSTLQERPSPLASEIGYGSIRHLARLDWIIERAAGRPKAKIAPAALDILRIGAYQLVCMPSVPSYAAVSESVEIAKRHARAAAGFVNWVLRRIGPEARELPRRQDIPRPSEWMATFYSFPLWLVKRWERRYGQAEAEAILAAMNTFPPLDLRVNTLRGTVEEVAEQIRREGCETLFGRYSPVCLRVAALKAVTGLPTFVEGRFYIQDESSQLASLALAPRRGERLLDACAGPGGKSTHLAEMAEGRAQVTALDPDAGRLARLRINAARLGTDSVSALQGDLRSPPFAPGVTFDRILVDAPCSSLGILRRHPELKWIKRPSDPERFAPLQTELLCRAADLLAPQGTLVYSTCTTEPEENEDVVRRFLDQRPHFRLGTPGRGVIRNLIELLTPEGFIRTFPHRHAMNASFVALLKPVPPSASCARRSAGV